ncbi:MAG: Transglutaminase-like enzyme putative cysteine protease [Labilithrix sp.]|nr:Transglutaminase-like enzyme putative cysteine protease [Labilithrix sp.]
MRTRTTRHFVLMSLLATAVGVAPGLLGLTTARGDQTSAPPPAGAAASEASARFLGETPDALIEAERRRALAPKATEADALTAVSLITNHADRASQGVAEKALADIASAEKVSAEVKGDAAVAARSLASDEGTAGAVEKARALGIVTDLSVLGPFRDTGGGLEAHDGPEQAKSAAAFGDPRTFYSWGTVEVAWRAVPPTFAQGHGVPLDMFVHPRKESCTFVASKIKLDAARPIVVRLAAAGTARLMFDGTDLGKSDDVHSLARLDRIAAQVEATAGTHLVAAKVCSGALEDVGRVRLRITDPKGAPVVVEQSASLALGAGETIAWGTAKMQKLTTALTRAIAGKGGPDALLEAAVIRTFSGADDQKSPRVAGELDAVLQSPGLDPDRLALAAWVSSGANKSGRLYRARAAADKAGDAATVAFIDRRLVEQHLETDMADWAIAQLRGTKLDAKTDDEARLLAARTMRSLRVDVLTIQTMRDLIAVFKAGRERVSNNFLVELTAFARSHDAQTWRAATEELAKRGIRGEVLVDAMGSVGKDAVVKAAQDAYAGGMDDADEALSVANHVTEAGAHDVAALLYRAAARWAPNRPETWAGLAREVAASSKEPKDQQLVLVALRRARELAPGEAKYRAELALRMSGGKPGAPSSEAPRLDDERWLTPIEKILARRKGVPEKPDVADRELHWLRAVRMHPDNRVSQLIQYAREIVIPPRTQQELFEPIPPEGDVTEILRARVHRKAGGIAFPVEEHNDGMRPRIRWPELEPGDTVEVVIRQWTSTAVGGRADAPYYFQDYAGATAAHPLLFNEVVVETLPGHQLYVDVLHDKLAPYRKTETDERGMHVVHMVWDNPLNVAEEPLIPTLTEVVPVIVGSTFHTWDDFRKWYAEAVRGFTEPDEEVRRMAAELTKGKTTRDQKLRALFEFVSDDIRYVNYVSGEWWLPNRPQQLLARREGDCDDKAMLLITLLKSVGIEAQEVMVQTRLTGEPSLLLSKNAAVPRFDHGIAYLPGPNGGQYLDATSPMSRLGPVPAMDARAYGLRMDAGPAEVVQLPASSPDDHGSDVLWTLTVFPDGSGEVTGEEKHSGDAAFWLRSNLTQAEARGQYVEDNLVGPWFPSVELDKNIDFKGDLTGGQASVKYKAKSRGMARREGKDLVLSLSPANTYGSSLAPLTTRTLPVQLPPYLAPSHQNRTTRVIAPAGFAWGDLPPGGEANGGAFGRAKIEIGRDPKDARVLLIKRSVVFDQHQIPVDKYAAWRGFIQQVDALMHKEVRLVPAGGEK